MLAPSQTPVAWQLHALAFTNFVSVLGNKLLTQNGNKTHKSIRRITTQDVQERFYDYCKCFKTSIRTVTDLDSYNNQCIFQISLCENYGSLIM